MTLAIQPLSVAIGSVVSGVDLSQPLSDALRDEIAAALVERQVLFFRDQHFSPAQHRAFAAAFGPLHIHPIYPQVAEVPEIIVLDTDTIDLADNAMWHTDVTFIETPPLGSVLTARTVPPNGGDTLWASGTAAYEGLSAPMQAFLAGLTATHEISKSFPVERFGADAESRERLERSRRDNPPVVHPVIRTHPVSGRKALFVNDGFTTRINELSPRESEALLAFLLRHFEKPEFCVRWKWQLGDVAFWDNRVTQHYANDDYRPHRRVMHRATILGDRPR